MLRRAAIGLVILLLVVVGYVAGIWLGVWGRSQDPGEVTPRPVPNAVIESRAAALTRAARRAGVARPRQILFGDLHVHTTFSADAFFWSLPLMQGEGAHPPADACDFARFCSGLDFWSINDHAESLTPKRWAETRESIRQCNDVAGDAANPDLVAFLGWEWTQVGLTPQQHYGHKNVVLLDTANDRVPLRPIAAGGSNFTSFRASGGGAARVMLPLFDFGNRQRYFDLDRYGRELRGAPLCAQGVDVRGLPADCVEWADTPRELYEKLAQWGFESVVIPHGTTWGATTPMGASWDGQLAAGQHDPDRQRLIEVYSGHGSSEEYRDWRAVRFDAEGEARCPEPSPEYTPLCWQAGEIIRARCKAAGLATEECETRAAEARQRAAEAGNAGILVVPGQKSEEWLDAGQCRDCFLPAFGYRPAQSVQYALALERPTAEASRFRFGFIASSDNHSARPGTGYKEVGRNGMTDQRGLGHPRWERLGGEPPEPAPRSVPVALGTSAAAATYERQASFWLTGGLVAVHAEGRDRRAIWESLQRKEVYGTSGPRILLWFDLVNPPDAEDPEARIPMGGELRMSVAPRFRVRAAGAFRQRPGCPEYAVNALSPERLESLCKGECYNPSDVRHRITRIEVVRIRPQLRADEPVAARIDDPWRSFPCDGDPDGCTVEFEDPDFVEAARDTVYYVRAIQEPTPAVNGGLLRCERDADGRCIRTRPCFGGYRTEASDDCLAPVEERAWSSPIFADFGVPD